ncbi:MAG TPA: dihydrofolate reductase family protein [Acidobacteriaceae bacterium]|nr:dihydrofolate reductase family protein [Acidobacteriaceae bacterium]
MRRIVYSVACSLDGFTARENHSADWLPSDQDYGLSRFFESVDTALIGRRTHDLMVKMGQPSIPGMATLVFSRNENPPIYEHVHWIKDEAVKFVSALREQPGKDIWLMGGSDLVRTFFAAHIVDEVRVAMVPILLGKGIPLISCLNEETGLKLIEHKVYSNGVLCLHYECL